MTLSAVRDRPQSISGARHAEAQGLVDRIVHALRATRPPLRDDVAIMVLPASQRRVSTDRIVIDLGR